MLCHFDTAVQDTAVFYEIVDLDSVQESWNWAKALSLIFSVHSDADCKARTALVGSSSQIQHSTLKG